MNGPEPYHPRNDWHVYPDLDAWDDKKRIAFRYIKPQHYLDADSYGLCPVYYAGARYYYDGDTLMRHTAPWKETYAAIMVLADYYGKYRGDLKPGKGQRKFDMFVDELNMLLHKELTPDLARRRFSTKRINDVRQCMTRIRSAPVPDTDAYDELDRLMRKIDGG